MHIWHCSTAFPQSDPINFMCVENWRAPQTCIYEDCYICMCNILHYLFVSTEFGRKPGKVIHFPVVHYYICLEKLLKGYGLSWIEYIRQVECPLFFQKLTGVYSTIFEHVKIQRDFYLHLGREIWSIIFNLNFFDFWILDSVISPKNRRNSNIKSQCTM